MQEYGFNPYAAGNKVYGMIRRAPNIGAVDKLGYRERNAEQRARNAAILKRIQNKQAGKFIATGGS